MLVRTQASKIASHPKGQERMIVVSSSVPTRKGNNVVYYTELATGWQSLSRRVTLKGLMSA